MTQVFRPGDHTPRYRLPAAPSGAGAVTPSPGMPRRWDRDQDLKLNQIKVINDNFWQLVIGSLVGVGVLVGMTWTAEGSLPILLWSAVVLGLVAFRTLVFRRHKTEAMEPAKIDRVAFEMTSLAGLAGIAWGVGGIFFYTPGDFLMAVVLTLVLGGMISGCVATYASHPPVYIAFCTPVVVPFTAETFLLGGPNDWVAGFGLLVLFLINLSYCFNINKIIAESLALRFENMGLIENLRQERDRVEAASLQRTRFLAASSHDLRQPLHALGLLHSFLEDRFGAAVPSVFRRMKEARGVMLDMFNGLMDMARVESGALEPEVKLVNLTSLARDVAEEFKTADGSEAVGLDLPDRALFVQTDPVLLARILRNLIGNAAKFAPQAPVALRVRDTGENTAGLTVSDQGPGIAPDALPRIFGDYMQVEGKPGTGQGVGLGLAIVREFAAALGISVEVASELGRGTCFELSMPLADAPDVSASLAEGRRPSPSLPPGLIAIVEDDASIRDALEALLTLAGARTVAAASAEEVLSGLDVSPDALICDYNLGDGCPDGLAAWQRIQEEFNRDIPCALISGDIDMARASVPPGAAAPLVFLAKPVEPHHLLDQLALLMAPPMRKSG